MSLQFPVIKISGDARQRGLQYGCQCKDRIHRNWELYNNKIFSGLKSTRADLKSLSDIVRGVIFNFDAKYVTELDAIAEGASIEQWKIYALNARTEILNGSTPECTVLYFQNTSVLGQNWDWVREAEDLAILLIVDNDNAHRFATLTEPGMLGKIGLNSHGLGLCLNLLSGNHEIRDLPCHVLARSILDSKDLCEAKTVVHRSGSARASHFLVADDSKNFFSVEFSGNDTYELDTHCGILVHTNHLIGRNDIRCGESIFDTSYKRLSKSQHMTSALLNHEVRDMKKVLCHSDDSSSSINANYGNSQLLSNCMTGTCATIIMDLDKQLIHIARGPNGKFACAEI